MPRLRNFSFADFYCYELLLIIELDGDIHDKQQEQDRVRTELMESNGYRVLRFKNTNVLDDWSFVEGRSESFLR